ncbi:MAG: P-loop NTPase fold protein [Anaerovoracaceae bacterium]
MDKLDILNRDAFVEQVIKLLENISDNKAATCFAIDGEWGTGKSFVLDMLEEQLNGPYSEKYFVVRYNSWKYDYYEEPLIAIVSSIIAEIEEKVNFFPDSQEKQEILGMFKAAGVSLLSMANTAFKAKTGLDIQSAYEIVIKGEKEGAAIYEKEHAYDTYLGLNKVIDKLSALLQEIASDYTVVIIVDELDRCIPEYAIKVMERLHHLTEGKNNIITIIAMDKKQLECSIRHLFGFAEDNKYLEKFINFEIKLNKGEVSENILEKYADYLEMFDKETFQFEDFVEECLQAIFKNIDVRKQEQIVNKSTIVHKLLFKDKKDYSFMCMELLTAVMVSAYKYRGLFDGSTFNTPSYGGLVVSASKANSLPFGNLFKEKFESINLRNTHSFPDESEKYLLPPKPSLYGAIIFTWCWMHSKRSVSILRTQGDVYSAISDNYTELIKFAEMISLM